MVNSQFPGGYGSNKVVPVSLSHNNVNVAHLLQFRDQSKPLTFFGAFLAVVCYIFGVLNVYGSMKSSSTTVEFSSSSCSSKICSQKVKLGLTGKTFVYLDYDFLLTSYFIFAKGTSYIDIFKKQGYQTDTSDCYPVATFQDYKNIVELLGLPSTLRPKIVEGIRDTPNSKISPCGLKAALFDFLGSLGISYNTTGVIALTTEGLVNARYKDYIVKSDQDFLDVSQERFFAWYLPEIPAFGTKLFYGIAENDLNGEFTFTFNNTNTFWNSEATPKVILVQVGSGVWAKFGNFTFGVTMLIYGTLALAAIGLFWYVKKHNY